jgi:hypothetical protein
MSAVAVETAVELQNELRAVLKEPAVSRSEARSVDEDVPATNGDIQPWELHSELVLVCPEVCKRALELLPERDPDAFLARPREPIVLALGTPDEGQFAHGLPASVFGYVVWRLVETARSALFAVGGLVALASLVELVH